MKITKDKWVEIEYTLTGDDGKLIDSSEGKGPLGYVHGYGSLISGLEKELEGKEPGAKFTAVIAPKDGYGEFDQRMIMEIDRSQFEGVDKIEVGMMFQVMTQGGPAIVRVVKVADDKITIDGNHELAGKTLHFDVEVKSVRDATEEELNPSCGGGCGGGCGGCGGEGGCGGNCGGGCGGDGECGGDCNCGGEGGCGGDCNCSKK